MKPSFEEIFLAELIVHGVDLCEGCDLKNSHARGFAVKRWVYNRQVGRNEEVLFARQIHLLSGLRTRASLHRALHEVGHIVNDKPGMRRWESEQGAERYANESFRLLGLSIPRKVSSKGRAYVARMKRWGKNIAKGIKVREERGRLVYSRELEEAV